MILLDVKMPSNCFECPMRGVDGLDNFCQANYKSDLSLYNLPDWCPIAAEISDNATNGDVIKTLFPKAVVNKHYEIINSETSLEDGIDVSIWMDNCRMFTLRFPKEWWNASYKEDK